MRVLVYGAGAVGQAIGGLLAEGGCEVAMLLRPRAAEIMARAGLRIEGIFGDHHIPPGRMRLMTDISDLDAAGFDFVLLTVKSYDTAAAADAIKRIDCGTAGCPSLGREPFTVVSMQNGYGNVERLAEVFCPDRVLCGRIITGFVIPQPGTVRITVHADAVTIGRFDGADSAPAERLAGALTAGLPSRASRQVQAELWAKILYNCALNPLGAILGVTYGELADRPETRAIMDRVIDEAYAAVRNYPQITQISPISRKNGAAESAKSVGMPPTAEEFRRAFYGRMVPPTAAHTPSMLQDLRAGKRTEIDALNGAIVALAERAGVAAPTNQALTDMVKFLEGRKSVGR